MSTNNKSLTKNPKSYLRGGQMTKDTDEYLVPKKILSPTYRRDGWTNQATNECLSNRKYTWIVRTTIVEPSHQSDKWSKGSSKMIDSSQQSSMPPWWRTNEVTWVMNDLRDHPKMIDSSTDCLTKSPRWRTIQGTLQRWSTQAMIL